MTTVSLDTIATAKFLALNAGSYTIGVIELDNSRSLNAITLEMFHAVEKRLLVWRTRADMACVVIDSNSDKAFCAGGDVKALVTMLNEETAMQVAAEVTDAEIHRLFSKQHGQPNLLAQKFSSLDPKTFAATTLIN